MVYGIRFIRTLLISICIIFGSLACIKQFKNNFQKKTNAMRQNVSLSFNEKKKEWVLENSKIEVKVGFDHKGKYSLKKLKYKQNNFSWIDKPLRFMEKSISLDDQPVIFKLKGRNEREFVFSKFSSGKDDESITLSLTFVRKKVELTHHLCLYRKDAVFESWISLLNNSPSDFTITKLKSVGIELSSPEKKIECFTVDGINPQLPYNMRIPHPSLVFKKKVLTLGKQLFVPSGHRSSELNLDWFAIYLPERQNGIFGGFEWSGQRLLEISHPENLLQIEYGLDQFYHKVLPGEVIESPKAVIGLFDKDIHYASTEMSDFARHYLMPPLPDDFPWFMYNTWFNMEINQSEETVKKDIDVCAELGVEGIYLDAGWYAHSPASSPAYFSEGIGLWKENRNKYPSGLKALSNYVHKKGMKFGLWVEPERVAEDTRNAESNTWTNEMLVMQNGKIIENVGPSYFVCLGNPSAQRWVLNTISRVVEEYNIDWLKWDNNMWVTCNRTDHGHQGGDGNWAQIQGLYEVLDTLRKKYPNLIIENCASGGNRMDLGILKRTHIFWVHDDSYTSYLVRFHFFGASLEFPAHYINSWVIEGGDLSREKLPISEQAVKYIFRSRMLGAAGISLNVRNWSNEIKNSVKNEIEFFKKNRKFLFGQVFCLTPQTVIFNKTWEPPTTWESYQYYLPESEESMIYCFRDEGSQQKMTLFPKEIKDENKYKIRFFDKGKDFIMTGKEILTKGIEVELSEKFLSEIIFISNL